MSVSSYVRRPAPVLLALAAAWGLFLLVLHPWMMGWGATPAERAAPLPGDAAPPSAYFTRAISIDVPPSAVWPWLMAIGQDRAGFLSNDWLENLFGGDIHNADVLLPEWDARVLGDKIPMAGEKGRRVLGDVTFLTVRQLEPERVLADMPGRFVLLPDSSGGTRLLLREPLEAGERAGLAWLVWDPMHFVMEQRMLRGIKERAESRPLVPPLVGAAARAGWLGAGLVLALLFASRRRWLPWGLAAAALALPPLYLTGDADSVLAAFLVLGITVMGALRCGKDWLGPYALVAAGVLLLLVLAPDAYAAFGLLFLVVVAFAGARAMGRPISLGAAGFR